jgi:hypothetical protein
MKTTYQLKDSSVDHSGIDGTQLQDFLLNIEGLHTSTVDVVPYFTNRRIKEITVEVTRD